LKDEKYIQNFVENLKKRDHFGDLGKDGDNIKMDLCVD
jgi:hypothetical protein